MDRFNKPQFLDTTTEFGNVNAIIEKINKLNAQRTDALRNIPNFAEYNDEERTKRTQAAREKINNSHDLWLAEAKKGIERQERVLKLEINQKRHPETTVTEFDRMGGQTDAKKMQSALDLNNAIGLMSLLKQKFPTEIVKDLFEQGKVELASTLIDVGLKIPTGNTDEQNERAKFVSVSNGINKALGVTPLMKELAYTERAKKEVELSTAQYIDSVNARPENMISRGFAESQLNTELDNTLANLEK